MKKFLKNAAVATLVVATFAVFTMPASATTVEELQAQITALLAQITALKGQLAGAGGSTTSSSLYNWTRDLTLGSQGADVKALQEFLNANGSLVASSGVGSAGQESEYFGSLTKAALASFQASHSINPPAGYFGPITRAYIVANFSGSGGGSGSGNGNGNGDATGNASIALASSNPAASTIPDGSLYNPMLKVAVSGGANGVTVTGLTVSRGGFIANTNVTGVSVWDENGNRLGNIITALTAGGQATVDFGSNDLVVGAGQTKTLTVKANISASAGSGTVSFAIASASDVQGGTVEGSFPLTGNLMSVVDGSSSLGNVWVDNQSIAGLTYSTISSASGNVEVGDVQREVAKISFQQANSKEDVQLEGLTVYIAGTIQESTDVTNWKLYSPEGDVLASADRPSGRFVTFNLASPYVIEKGVTKNLSVKADITDGSSRYFQVSVQNDYDVQVKGVTTGAYVAPLDGSGGSFSSTDVGGLSTDTNGFKIKQGALTVTKSSGSPSGNIAPGSNNVTLANFDLKSSGEAFEVRKMHIGIDYNSATLTGTVVIKDADSGTVYASVSADTSGLQATSLTYSGVLDLSLSSYMTIGAGETRHIEITGSTKSTAGSSASYQVSVGGFYGKRMSTNDYTTLPNSTTLYSANQLSVTDVSLTTNKNAAFADTTRAPGSTAVKVGEFVFQASSADAINVTGLNLSVTNPENLQNMMVKVDGSEFGTTIGTPSATANSFSGSASIAKSASAIVSVYADVVSTASSTSVVSVHASGVSGYGVDSSTNLSLTPASALAGQTMTFTAASLTIKKDAGAPSSAIVMAGSSLAELSKINLEASNESLTLRKITLSVVNATGSLQTALSKVYLYDGTSEVGSAYLSGTSTVFSGLDVTLSQDTPKTLTVKADITGSGTLTSLTVGAIKVKSSSTSDLEVYSNQGLMSSNVTLTSNATGNYMLFTDAAPEIAWAGAASGTKTPNSADVVGVYTITNAGSRTITLSSVKATVTVSGANASGTVSNFRIYDSSDTLLDTQSTTMTGATTTDITFAVSTSTTQEIAAGSSKTYTIKANTTNIRTGLSSGQYAYLNTEVGGSKGYNSNNSTSESKWNDGYVTYSFTPANGGTQITGNNASDSVPVTGSTYTY